MERDRDLRNYLSAFENPPADYSLVAVEPRRRVQIFALPPNTVLSLGSELEKLIFAPIKNFFYDSSEDLVAFVSVEVVHPDWLNSTAYDTVAYDLHLACSDVKRRYLFIQSATEATTQAILDHYHVGLITPVSPQKINRVLHAYDITAYSSVGIRNNRPSSVTGHSYTTFSGHAAEDGLQPMDEVTASAGHVAARYWDGHSTATIGTSLDRAKIWGSGRSSLFDFKEWCESLAEKLSTNVSFGSPPLLNVPIRDRSGFLSARSVGSRNDVSIPRGLPTMAG